MNTPRRNIPFTLPPQPARVRRTNNTPSPTIALRDQPRVTAALLPHTTPGVILLRLSDGHQRCIGLGGPAPGLHPGALRGLTEDEARELTERHEAAHVRSLQGARNASSHPQRWTTLPLSLEG